VKRGDLYWLPSVGVCVVVDFVTKQDEGIAIAAYAPPKSNETRFTIINEADAIPIALAPQLEKLMEIIKAGTVLG